MTEPPKQRFDLSDPTQVWSLCVAEESYEHANGNSDYHCFLMLVSDGPNKPRILDELHFIPVNDREGLCVPLHKSGTENGSEVTEMPCIGAASYRYPLRRLAGLINTAYMQGEPVAMLHSWNNALRAALQIHGLRLSFGTNGCRTAAKAVIENLGYVFEPSIGTEMAGNIDANIASGIAAPSFEITASESVLLATYHRLHRELQTPYLKAASAMQTQLEEHTPELGRAAPKLSGILAMLIR